MPPPTPSYSQYFHGEKALGGGTRTAFEATDPLLFVDVVLSGDRNKIRVPVCRGDSPKQVRLNTFEDCDIPFEGVQGHASRKAGRVQQEGYDAHVFVCVLALLLSGDRWPRTSDGSTICPMRRCTCSR